MRNTIDKIIYFVNGNITYKFQASADNQNAYKVDGTLNTLVLPLESKSVTELTNNSNFKALSPSELNRHNIELAASI